MSVGIKVARAGSQGGVPIGRQVSQGDPGLFGDIFGGLKSIGKAAIGVFAPPGVSRILGLGGGGRAPASPRNIVAGNLPTGVPKPGVIAFSQQLIPGGATGLGTGCASGHRPNKSDYFLRDGTFVAAGTRCVKTRRRNPANARATSRAISRINGAKRMQHTLAQIETGRFTKAGKHKHHKHS